MDQILKKFDRLTIFFIVYTIIFFTFFKTLTYTLPFVLAFIFALILRIPSRFLMKKLKLKSSTASLITTFSFYSIFFLVVIKLLVYFVNEVIILAKNISLYIAANNQLIFSLIDRIKEMYNNLDPAVLNALENSLNELTHKLSANATSIATSLASGTVNFITNFVSSIPYIVMLFVFTLISTYFFTKDISSNNSNISSQFNNDFSKLVFLIKETKRMLFNYTKSYLILITITFVITFIGFSIFGIPYAFVLSVLCAILDLVPVLGMPIIYFPLALFNLFIAKNFFVGIGLLILYLFLFIFRQIVEPKLVSANLDLHPVAVLAAFFIGLQANGIGGMIYCIFLVVFYNILKKVDVI